MGMDFNNAEGQRELIPAGSICKLVMNIKPGGGMEDGWYTQSNSSDSQYLNCEFTVTEGPLIRRKLWQNLTMFPGHEENHNHQAWEGRLKAVAMSRSLLRAILESARNINSHDQSDAALRARKINGLEDFNGLEFVAKVGIEKGTGGYADKNKIQTVITPEMKEYAPAMSGQTVTPEASGKQSWGKPASAPEASGKQAWGGNAQAPSPPPNPAPDWASAQQQQSGGNSTPQTTPSNPSWVTQA